MLLLVPLMGTTSFSMFDGMEDDIQHPSDSSIISPGFGAAINSMIPLVNVHDEEPKDKYSSIKYKLTTSGVTSQSPGAGAFTFMTGRQFVASKDIEPFAELYADYGENYFTGRDGYETVPFVRHYKIADQFIERYMRKMKKLRDTAEAKELKSYKFLSSLDFEKELWNELIIRVRDEIWNDSKILHALPGRNTTLQYLQELVDFGGARYQRYNDTIKNQEWLNENGQCMDSIGDGVSRIPHAGRGAFARRFIPKGGLVAPAPLIHIPYRHILTIYREFIGRENNKWERNVSAPIHQQLLLNYCFGHRESTLLLCPYGLLTFLINHDSKNPNTRVVWSKQHRHAEWLEKPIDEWCGTMHNGLNFDYVALRDIEQGEEITIDYGPEWEEAWQKHVETFDPPRRNYVPAFELNTMIDLKLPTDYEPHQQFEGVLMFCREYYFPNNHGVEPFITVPDHDEDKGGDDKEEEEQTYSEKHFLCRILKRNDSNNTYIAEVFEREEYWIDLTTDVKDSIKDTPALILFDLPRDAFYFKDIPCKCQGLH
jgi:hypothetical protein